jgi:hypothetical protein
LQHLRRATRNDAAGLQNRLRVALQHVQIGLFHLLYLFVSGRNADIVRAAGLFDLRHKHPGGSHSAGAGVFYKNA